MNRFPGVVLQLVLAALVGYGAARYAINTAPVPAAPPATTLPAPAAPPSPVAPPTSSALQPSADGASAAGAALSVSYRTAVERASPSVLTVHSM